MPFASRKAFLFINGLLEKFEARLLLADITHLDLNVAAKIAAQ